VSATATLGGVENVRGTLIPNISGSVGSDRGSLRRRHSAEKAVPFPSAARRLLNLLSTEGGDTEGWFMNEISRSKRIKNVVSLQVARERARPPRDGSNRYVSKRSNQKLLERLEAENAQLRGNVVHLLLQIQALRGGAR
jgi:hypothetical protein